MKVLVLLLIFGLLVSTFAHKNKHYGEKDHDGKQDDHKPSHDKDDDDKKHHNDGSEENDDDDAESKHHFRVCHYKSAKGVEYDLRLLNRSIADYSIFDKESRSTFFFRPCGAVHTTGACHPESAVCMIDSSGKATNFGTAKDIQWADGLAAGASIEATYPNGELCSSGIPRKTVVEYRCTLGKTYPHLPETRLVSVMYKPDSCFVQLVMDSPHACPTKEFCQAVTLPGVCDSSDGLCVWEKGHCVVNEKGCARGHWRHGGPLAILSIMTLTMFFLSLCLGLCCCVCRRVARRRLERRCQRKQAQQGEELEKMVQETPTIPEQEQQPPTESDQDGSHPTAPHYQPIPIFYPGQQIPVSPYSVQGYPMMQFMPIPQQPKTEESA